MFDEKEKKLIKKYSLLPVLSIAFLVMALLIGFVWILLVMINDMVFYGDFYSFGLYAYLGIVVIYVIAFILCFFIPKIGMRKEIWKNIVQKTKVTMSNEDYSSKIIATLGTKAAGILLKRSDDANLNKAGEVFDAASAIGAVTTVSQMSNEISKNAKKVANVCDIELPKPKKYILTIVLAPVLLLTLLYIPHYITSKQIMDTNKEMASQSVYTLESAFKQDCDRVYIDDPMEEYDEKGYYVYGYLYDSNESESSNIAIVVGNDGLIHEVRYSIDINLQASKEENLQRVESDVMKLNELLKKANVQGLFSELLELVTLPEDFQSQFIESSYYESIYYSINDSISIDYVTDSEEGYDEYSNSYIYIEIE